VDDTERFFALDPGLIAAPWALYEGWRDAGPVIELPFERSWAVTDFDLAVAVLRDAARWSSSAVDGPRPAALERWTAELVEEEPELEELLAVPLLALLALGPPDHTRLRRALIGHLSAARVRALAPLVDGAVAELLPTLMTAEPFDAVARLSRPLPIRVVGHLLGLPPEQRDGLAALALAASTSNPHLETRAALRDRLHAELGLKRAFAALLRDPAEGSLLGALHEDVAAGRLSEREALGLCREVIVAGTETTADHISSVLLLLARDPARLDAEPAWLIEEALRLESPFVGFWRRATEAVTLGGVELPAGALLLVPFAALNRAPSVNPARHLAFGYGIHFCVGAPLARLQSDRVLAALLPRLRAIELVEEPRYRPSVQSRGVESLIVRLVSG
jgi:cytochrome P450